MRTERARTDDGDRTVIVTGAGRGIGRAVVQELRRAGDRVLAVDRDFPDEMDGDDRARHRERRLTLDLTETYAPEEVMEEAVRAFGWADGLVNCAGIFPTSPALDIGQEDWDAMMSVNLRAPFFLAQAFARHQIGAERSGFVINVTSTAAEVTRPGIAHYSASKAALTMLTKTLALEWAGYGIRVNAVAPGLVDTPGVEGLQTETSGREEHRRKIANIPVGRPGRAEEVARSVRFLASEDAEYITGQSLVVDGGYSAGRSLRSTTDTGS